MKAFILCAGLGKRLRPITEEIPKPLLPFLGRPLIHYVLERLKEIKIKDVCINLHWLPEKIKKYLKNFEKDFNFHFFYEKELLDTGGALKNAREFLKNSSFIVINGDIIFDFSLRDFISYHQEKNHLGTLMITDNEKTNNLIISMDGKLKSISNKFSKKYKTFAGIAIYKPEILEMMEGEIFSIKDIWKKSIKNNLKIDTYYIDPKGFKECGSVEGYAKTLFFFLKKEGEKNYISKNSKIKNVNLKGFNIIEEKCKIDCQLTLKNSIILPGAIVKKDESFKIIGKKFKVNIPKNLFHPEIIKRNNLLKNFTKENKILLNKICGSGSLRNFYSFKKNKKSYIFMESSKEDKEFERYIKLNNFLKSHNFPVPEIKSYSLREKNLIMEDCGEHSLYDKSKFLKIDEIENLYKKVIDKVCILHSIDLKKDKIFSNYEFNKEYFLWETNYFFENFIINYLKIDISIDLFKDDFAKLAEISSSFEKRVLHRDLQSQNILISEKNNITFIDFQSARLGPPGYDISSLLWDPYLILPECLRSRLLDYYKEKMGDKLQDAFDESLKYLKTQRHFQTLGAYAFLSLKKGKKNFLKFIEPAKKLLFEDLKELNNFNSFKKIKKFIS